MKYPINPAKFIQGLSMRQKGVAFLLSIACAANIVAAPISSDEAAGRARAWMQGHPIMGVAAASGVQAITAFPDDTPPDCVYVVELLQGGYLVLTSDDRLEPVIAYSAASTVNLEDRPDNAFRALLLHYVAGLPETLDALPDVPWQAPLFAPLAGQQYGPYTETKWNQDYPYNLYCPTFSNPPNDSRRGRVPVGCVPTAWAQVMKYHSWPPYGQGGHTHASGSYPPVDFTTPFNWDNMQDVYSYLITTSQPGDVDVAALMYKLGIAADITYAASGSSADMNLLGVRIRDSMFYDAFSYVIAGAVTVSPFLKSDIQAGFPGILGIPGHAVVADGLSADEAFYHINYGWGGANDNWYALSALNVNCGLTQIRPSLMAFPCDKTVAATENSPVTLHWELPQWRANEADKINVKQLVSHTTTWTHNAENFS